MKTAFVLVALPFSLAFVPSSLRRSQAHRVSRVSTAFPGDRSASVRASPLQVAKFDIFEPSTWLSNPAVVGGVAAFFLFSNSVAIIPPGEVGLISTLGSLDPTPLEAGLHVKSPLANIRQFSVKTILAEEENFVPTKEGLTVELDTALLYRLDPSSVSELYLTVGGQYEQVIIKPELRSIVRGLTSESEAKALYTSGRGEIQSKIKAALSEALSKRGIIVEDILLKAVKLPNAVSDAIELKAQAEQEAQRMEFVLQKERQEAERKKIEAQGIADFQKIVSDGISPNLLKWKGIEATEKLAKSDNSKIVIMGNSKDSLPVILGGPDSK